MCVYNYPWIIIRVYCIIIRINLHADSGKVRCSRIFRAPVSPGSGDRHLRAIFRKCRPGKFGKWTDKKGFPNCAQSISGIPDFDGIFRQLKGALYGNAHIVWWIFYECPAFLYSVYFALFHTALKPVSPFPSPYSSSPLHRSLIIVSTPFQLRQASRAST